MVDKMPEAITKRTFYNKVRKQGGSYVISLPPKIVEKNNIEQGDEIGFQNEHSKKIEQKEDRENGKYFSAFNETIQSGDRKPEGDQ